MSEHNRRMLDLKRCYMSFEPKVLESVKRHRRNIARARLVLVAPFALAALFGLVLLLVTVFLGGRLSETYEVADTMDALFWSGQGATLAKLIAALLCVVLVGGLGYNVFASARYARGRFEMFLQQQALDYEPTDAAKFENALQGAAIGAGVPAPCMLVLDDPAANAAAFQTDSGAQGVGVTSGLLRSDISVGEANAVMAHELAHLVIGENVRAPSITDLEFQPSLLLVLFGVLCAASVLVAPLNIYYILLLAACAAAAFVALVLVYHSDAFIVKLLNLEHHHDDILADSLAVKMTRDPAALKSAIRKVEMLARRTGRVPGGTILTRYLFVTPPTSPGDYYRYATRVAQNMLAGRRMPRTWMLFTRPANRAMRRLLEMESRMTVERLINLDLIEQGRWRALEDWRRD